MISGFVSASPSLPWWFFSNILTVQQTFRGKLDHSVMWSNQKCSYANTALIWDPACRKKISFIPLGRGWFVFYSSSSSSSYWSRRTQKWFLSASKLTMKMLFQGASSKVIKKSGLSCPKNGTKSQWLLTYWARIYLLETFDPSFPVQKGTLQAAYGTETNRVHSKKKNTPTIQNANKLKPSEENKVNKQTIITYCPFQDFDKFCIWYHQGLYPNL